jgi:ABC-type multidrug transport system fused ATPase/permease subunit
MFVVQTILNLVSIKLAGDFIDATVDILERWDSFTVRDFFFTDSFRLMAYILAIWIISKSIDSLRAWLFERIKRSVRVNASTAVLEKVSNENLQEVEKMEFQKLISFVPNYSIERLINTYDTFSTVIKEFIRMVSSLAILIQALGLSPLLLVLFSVTEPFILYLGKSRIKNFRLKEVEGVKFVEYLNVIALQISNFQELRANGIYRYIIDHYRDENKTYNDGMVENFKHYYIDNAFFAMVGQILLTGYKFYILFVAIVQSFTIGRFKALFDYASNAYSAGFFFLRAFFDLFDHISYTDEFFALLDYEGFGDKAHGDVELSGKCPVVRFDELDFKYPGDKKKVLENITFEIKPGEKVAIVGGDGSGKSTLVRILCGLYAIQTGEYYLNDYSVKELERGQLKKHISVIFQDFIKYDFTIRENIINSGEGKGFDSELYEKVKSIADVDNFMEREGFEDDQMLGKFFEGGKEVSPGYWQRIAIARMLYRNRNIFIMDEPFTYIDSLSQRKILGDIFEFIGNKKVLIFITRSTENLNKFDRIIYLKEGRIAESSELEDID